MKVVIIKYNAGNNQSVLFALERIGINATVTDNPELIQSADKIIFPGVGHAGSAMEYLLEHKLDKLIVALKQPVMGICLGMQLMCNYSEEGNTNCLGIYDTKVKLFQLAPVLKVPQIGWNSLNHNNSVLFKNIPQESYVYYVHSYYAELSADAIAMSNYGHDFCAALQKNNFFGVQFHPEKSATVGHEMLENFIRL